MEKVRKLVIVGGTHGNERTGVQCVKRWQRDPAAVQRPSFSTAFLLANTDAIKANRRYLEQDLNRCFAMDTLQGAAQNREQRRAQEINALLGPKGSDTQTDFILDLHTTTANMGMTLVVQQHDPLALSMAAYIRERMPDATVFYEDNDPMEDNFLCSVARHSLLIEVGPIPQGLLRWDVYAATQQAVLHALDFLESWNSGAIATLSGTLDVYEFICKLHLPRDAGGEVCGMIHPEVQDRDYHALQPGDPLFITDDGETLVFDGEETVYTAFVNEAAYYDQQHGLSLMRKRRVSW